MKLSAIVEIQDNIKQQKKCRTEQYNDIFMWTVESRKTQKEEGVLLAAILELVFRQKKKRDISKKHSSQITFLFESLFPFNEIKWYW